MGVRDMAVPAAGPLPHSPRGGRRAPAHTPGAPPRGTLLPSSSPATTTTRREATLQRTPDQQAEQEVLGRLVRQCIAGDQQAWQQLVVSQHRRIYGLCYRFTGSASDAEDLTQDVFLKLYRNLASFDVQKGNFNTWLTALARNLLVDH